MGEQLSTMEASISVREAVARFEYWKTVAVMGAHHFPLRLCNRNYWIKCRKARSISLAVASLLHLLVCGSVRGFSKPVVGSATDDVLCGTP